MLQAHVPGVWATPAEHARELVVLDTRHLLATADWNAWRMLYRRAPPEEYGLRIAALLGEARPSTLVLMDLSRRLHMNRKAMEHPEAEQHPQLAA
jgi:hypothetical protein